MNPERTDGAARLARFGHSLVLLTVLVAVFAVTLVAVGLVSYRQAVGHAREGLRARLADRAYAVVAAVRAGSAPTPEAAAAALAPLRPSEGWVRVFDGGGAVLASSRSGESGRRGTPLDLPPPTVEPPPPPRARFVDGGRALEVCLVVPPAKRHELLGVAGPSPGAGLPASAAPELAAQPLDAPRLLAACAGMSLDEGLVGVTAARVQVAASVVAAILFGLLALLNIRQARRAAAVAVASERRERLAHLGQLAAIVAHEVRTPLATIRGFAQLLVERLAGDDERRRGPAEKIVAETDRLSRLAEDLLGYARPAPLRSALLDVSALARQCAERLAPTAAASRVRLLADVEGATPLYADADRLAQAIDNLVINAIQHSPPDETVLLRVARARGGVVVEVADRGPGVPPEERDRIFEPFHTRRSGGTGLGLAIARRVADEHGGTLALDERRVEGALFRLTLPMDREPTENRSAA